MNNKQYYLRGMRDGIPIFFGYLAVGFTLGIAAKKIGINALGAGIMSFLMHASAGEFALLSVIVGKSSIMALIITQIIMNIRYFLMSANMAQRLPSDTSLPKRLLIAYFVTDEIFGISACIPGELNPYYPLGAATVASPGWVFGTALGVIVGNILPDNISNALGVALYGMFLAVVIPASKKNKIVAGVVIISMLASLLFEYIPMLCDISSGTKIIILTLIIASSAAILFPVKEDKEVS